LSGQVRVSGVECGECGECQCPTARGKESFQHGLSREGVTEEERSVAHHEQLMLHPSFERARHH
jgi:hypothetical protein